MEIPEWTAGSYDENVPVYKIIDDIAYIFIAKADGTTTEPTLTSTTWQLIGKNLTYNSNYTY
jgi:hypothetical protein